MKHTGKLRITLWIVSLLCLCMGLTTAHATGTVVGPFTVSGGIEDRDYRLRGKIFQILTETPLTIQNTDPSTPVGDVYILVSPGGSAHLTLNGVNIANVADKSALEIYWNSSLTLTLAEGSTNTLEGCRGGENFAAAGINNAGKGLIINGTGALNATGGYDCAGIGGNANKSGGTITIQGGTITATGGYGAAGIGGGRSASSGNIAIQGGHITATGGSNAAGIGGGLNASNDNINISGGTVFAKTTSTGAAGIGGGSKGSGGTITISGGDVTAVGGYEAAGIGSGDGLEGFEGVTGGDITISGGVVRASGHAGIGSGLYVPSGTFSTGENGNSFIQTSSITDQTNKDSWQGIIIEDAIGMVYGDITLDKNITIDADKTLLVPDGVTLTVPSAFTLENQGKIILIGTGRIIGSVTGNQPINGASPQAGDFLVTGGINAVDFIYDAPTLHIKTDKALTIVNKNPGTPTENNIVIEEDVHANLTLAGVHIETKATLHALSISNNSSATITLQGENLLHGGVQLTETGNSGGAGIDLSGNARLIITKESTGSLQAVGEKRSPGIGAGKSSTSSIAIHGGTITATGGTGGAGIGGGFTNDGIDVTITGGKVTATGYTGIGHGQPSASGSGNFETGTFKTGASGTAWIKASGIADQSQKTDWTGIIIDGKNSYVGGAQVLPNALTIENDETMLLLNGSSLTLPRGTALTNQGTLSLENAVIIGEGELLGNGNFYTNTLSVELIADIPDQMYTGSAIEPTPTLKTSKVIKGKTFVLDSNTWVKSYENNVDVGTANVVYSRVGYDTVKKPFAIVKGTLNLNVVLSQTSVTYGDTVNISFTPSIQSAITPAAASKTTVAVYLGNTLLAGPEEVSLGNTKSFSIPTSEQTLDIGENTLTVVCTGNDNLAEKRVDKSVTLAPKGLTWLNSGQVEDKEYDGTNSASVVNMPRLQGYVNTDDDVTVSATATFNSIYPASSTIPVTVATCALGGADAKYYTLNGALPSFAPAIIYRKEITVSSVVASDKAYDGTTNATITQATLSGLVPGETLTFGTDFSAYSANFQTANVGDAITVVAKLQLLNTAKTNNYTLSAENSTTTTASITKSASTLGTVTTYEKNSGNATSSFTYGETVVVKFTPAVSPVMARAKSVSAPQTATLYYGETLLDTVLNVTENTPVSFTVDTSLKALPKIAFNGQPQTLTIKWTGDHNLEQSQATTQITLNLKKLTWSVGAVENKPYDGKISATVTTEPTLQGLVSGDEVHVVKGSATFSNANAGDHTVMATDYGITGDHSVYYSINTQPTFTNASITKVDYTGTKTVTDSKRNGETGSILLLSFFEDFIDVTYGKPVVVSDPKNIIKHMDLEYEVFDYEFVDDASKAGSTATVTFPVTSRNYNDFEFTVILTLTAKAKPSVYVQDIQKVYDGEELSLEDVNWKATHDGQTVPGTLALKVDDWPKDVADSGEKIVIFSPDDQDEYSPVETKIKVTIQKAPLTIRFVSVDALVGTEKPSYQIEVSGLGQGQEIIDIVFNENPMVDMQKIGRYEVTPSEATIDNGTMDNYVVTYETGYLTVTTAPIAPDTGDATPLGVLTGLALLSGIGITITSIKKHKMQ